MIYGSDDPHELVDKFIVLPRSCELCLKHPAVYYECAWWPATYMCRPCVDRGESERRSELAGLAARSDGAARTTRSG